jgi:hypothetical protein
VHASAALARSQKSRSSGPLRPRLQLASRQRRRDDPFEREAEANAHAARTGGALRDLRDVRIHADEDSSTAARTIGAHAFTVGSDVFFGRDEYRPSTAEGRGLLAHELTHVEQQRTGAAAPGLQGSWWEGAGAIIGGVAGAVVGGILGGVGGAVALGAFGALAGAGIGHALRWLTEGDPDIDRTEPDDKGLAENDPKFQETFQKQLQAGMKYLARSSCAFPAGGQWKYDDRYWDRVNDPNYVAYKPKGVSPAKAFDELLDNINLWEFDCAIYPEVIWIYAYRKTLGATNFNSRFPDLILRTHETKGTHRDFYTLESEGKDEFDRKWDDAPAGAKVMWTNRSKVTIDTAWHNENAIKRTKGATPEDSRYDAHPLGADLSEKEVKKGLASNASDWPTGISAQESYMTSNIYRHQLHILKV